MNNVALLCATVAISWGIAPQLGRLSGMNAMMMTVWIAVGTLVATVPVAVSQNYASLTTKTLALVVAGGIFNGIGLLAFYRLVAGSGEGLWEMSKVLPAVFVCVPIAVAIGAWLFFGEKITLNKFIGLGLACGAIWFLNK